MLPRTGLLRNTKWASAALAPDMSSAERRADKGPHDFKEGEEGRREGDDGNHDPHEYGICFSICGSKY